MIFSEVYSAYYTAVAFLISKAINGELNDKNAAQIIKETAFSESFVYILDNIKSEQWQVVTKDYNTPIKNKPEMPLTTLQKRFIKTISLDPRFKLFCDTELLDLDNIEPLYSKDDLYYFDQIKDGDPYTDSDYIKNFRTVLRGLKEHKHLKIIFRDGKGNIRTGMYTPRKLEYSEKDDKFRLLCMYNNTFTTINLARINSCELSNIFNKRKILPYKRNKKTVILQIIDERNALERCMLHFANFEKETRQIDKNSYEMKLTYFSDDETEVIIRILSFGPMVKVLSPQSFIDLIIERLKKQKSCELV